MTILHRQTVSFRESRQCESGDNQHCSRNFCRFKRLGTIARTGSVIENEQETLRFCCGARFNGGFSKE